VRSRGSSAVADETPTTSSDIGTAAASGTLVPSLRVRADRPVPRSGGGHQGIPRRGPRRVPAGAAVGGGPGGRAGTETGVIRRELPGLARASGETWQQLMSRHVQDVRLQAALAGLWGYVGLPPSQCVALVGALMGASYLAARRLVSRGRRAGAERRAGAGTAGAWRGDCRKTT
jgi:hypothetical protein